MDNSGQSRTLIRLDSITRRFPGVTALDNVTFDMTAGECHALLGENGAGKSTLGKIVAGIDRPDAGQVLFDGRPVRFRSPLDAAAAGISIVHQELAFCPNLSVAENLFLGAMPARRGFVRWRDMQCRAADMLADVGLRVDPRRPMGELSTGQEQLAQIAVAIARGARVIVMDEPTSSLSQGESQRLFAIVDRLKRRGVTIIYVSHRLEEIRRHCDRVTVLRDGRFIDTVPASTDTSEIVRLMIGRPMAAYFPAHGEAVPGPPLLEVRGLSSPGRFKNVSFQVRAGEIVGLAGLVGAGRSEIARAVFGLDRAARGQVLVEGRDVCIRSPREAIDLGVGLLPEDRKRQGLVMSMTCRENVTLAMLDRLRLRGRLSHRRDREITGEFTARLRIRAPSVDSGVEGLSGGNQQKVALAKWLARQCRVLLLDEPTRGVDVGAKAEIHELIERLAAGQRAVLLISSDLPELLNLSTRVLVLAEGRLVGELPRAAATQEAVMRLMAGLSAA